MIQVKSRGGMGFKDISSFNQALITKQIWRLIQNPSSLAARVLKARYFKETDFLNASMGSNPSYIWRSIIQGRQVILKGYRWRIGNGENISVFRGNWIPRPSTFKPVSTPNLPSEATVAMLIDNENKWKADLIQKMFLKEDAETILSIPLPRKKRYDQVITTMIKKENILSRVVTRWPLT